MISKDLISKLISTDEAPPREFTNLIKSFGDDVPPEQDIENLRKAFIFGEKVHSGQARHSGETYFSHCIEVARILIEMKMDTVTIVAGLLHDTLEDTKVTSAHLSEIFGIEVYQLVDGVTKLSGIDFLSQETKQANNFRKMILSVAEDIRVLIIKFADRLHNMLTIMYLPEVKRKRIAEETLSVYSPLAHRMGMAQLKWKLEDLCLQTLDPDTYNTIEQLVKDSSRKREKYITKFIKPISVKLKKDGLENFRIFGRAKHLFSIHRKMKEQNRPFEDIYDLLAIRIIVHSVPECYQVMGTLHGMYNPIDHRIKDFISKPKRNGYQSVHTTIIGQENKMVEIQIRTEEMDHIAEQGIAAHWSYKEGKVDKELERQVRWLRDVVKSLQTDSVNSEEFLELLKIDLFRHEIFVFTPTGDLIQLPTDSTPIDFAYEVHTAIGNHCVGAKVNGDIKPLNYSLQNGDRVDIITSSSHLPSSTWLKSVKTSKARVQIKKHIKMEQHESAIRFGKSVLEKEFRKQGEMKIFKQLKKKIDLFGFTELDQLYLNVGNGNLTFRAIARKVLPPEKPIEENNSEEEQEKGFLRHARESVKGVTIQGVSDIMIRFAKCCNPVPGDGILGFITRGQGVSVHRGDCNNISVDLKERDRVINVEWDIVGEQNFLVRLRVEGEDRKNMIKDLTEILSTSGINIHSLDMRSMDGYAIGQMVIFVVDLEQLNQLIQCMRNLPGVFNIERR